MKLVVLKLISLVVLLAGALILGLNLEFSQPHAERVLGYVKPYLPTTAAGDIDFSTPAVKYVGGGLMLIFGLYGFLPRLPKGRGKRQVAYSEKHGDVVIELDPAEHMLNRVIRNLPEVRSMAIRIKADEDARGVLIDAKGVLNSQLGVAARDTRAFVNAAISTTATDILGLEVVPPINLKIKYTEVDVETATEALHDKLFQREPAAAPDEAETGLEAMPVIGEAIPEEDRAMRMESVESEASAPMDEPGAPAAEALEEAAEAEEVIAAPEDEVEPPMPEPPEALEDMEEAFDEDAGVQAGEEPPDLGAIGSEGGEEGEEGEEAGAEEDAGEEFVDTYTMGDLASAAPEEPVEARPAAEEPEDAITSPGSLAESKEAKEEAAGEDENKDPWSV